jgi:hypothetical protein
MDQCQLVGVVIAKGEGSKLSYLVEYRQGNPRGLAFPGREVGDDETIFAALDEVVFAKTGVRIRLGSIFIPDPCGKRQESSAAEPGFWIYKAKAPGVPRVMSHTEQKFVRYLSLEEMEPYIASGETHPVWFDRIYQALKKT